MPGMTYEELLQQMKPRPIRSASGLDRTYKLIDQLMSERKLSRSQSEMLELLSMLVEQYESREHPTPKVSPKELLAHLLEVRGMTGAEVSRQTGIARSTVSQILNGRRRISTKNVTRLAKYFDVAPRVFLDVDES